MTAEQLAFRLNGLGACAKSLEWVRAVDLDLERAWGVCQRPAWLMWLAVRVGAVSPERATVVLMQAALAPRADLPAVAASGADLLTQWVAGSVPDEAVLRLYYKLAEVQHFELAPAAGAPPKTPGERLQVSAVRRIAYFSWAASLERVAVSVLTPGLFSPRTADAAGDVFFPVEEDAAKCDVIRTYVAAADVRFKMDVLR